MQIPQGQWQPNSSKNSDRSLQKLNEKQVNAGLLLDNAVETTSNHGTSSRNSVEAAQTDAGEDLLITGDNTGTSVVKNEVNENSGDTKHDSTCCVYDDGNDDHHFIVAKDISPFADSNSRSNSDRKSSYSMTEASPVRKPPKMPPPRAPPVSLLNDKNSTNLTSTDETNISNKSLEVESSAENSIRGSVDNASSNKGIDDKDHKNDIDDNNDNSKNTASNDRRDGINNRNISNEDIDLPHVPTSKQSIEIEKVVQNCEETTNNDNDKGNIVIDNDSSKCRNESSDLRAITNIADSQSDCNENIGDAKQESNKNNVGIDIPTEMRVQSFSAKANAEEKQPSPGGRQLSKETNVTQNHSSHKIGIVGVAVGLTMDNVSAVAATNGLVPLEEV